MSELTRIATVRITSISTVENIKSKEECAERIKAAIKKVFCDVDDVDVTADDIQDFIMDKND